MVATTEVAPPLDLVTLTDEKIALGAIASAVVCPTAGAIASFAGTTRDSFDGKRVCRLEARAAAQRPTALSARVLLSLPTCARCRQYEAHPTMAEREMRAICAAVRERWPVRHIAMVHRIGVVPVGEASVEIAVSSTHRREAIAAAAYAIDALKDRVPIWKKEVYDGDAPATWKANATTADGADVPGASGAAAAGLAAAARSSGARAN